MDSQDVHDMELHSPEEIARSLLSFPGMQLRHAATPTWWEWRARWDAGSRFIEVGMTLFEDANSSWGGSHIEVVCTRDDIISLWLHLQSRHRGIGLHDSNRNMHTRESFAQYVAA